MTDASVHVYFSQKPEDVFLWGGLREGMWHLQLNYRRGNPTVFKSMDDVWYVQINLIALIVQILHIFAPLVQIVIHLIIVINIMAVVVIGKWCFWKLIKWNG